MKAKTGSSASSKSFEVSYHSVRHISSPEDLSNNRKIYTGHVPITSIVNLPTDENVRDYLLDAEGKKRRVKTQVHLAIEQTLKETPHNFSVLNSGIVIVARNCEVDEKKKVLLLERPSIINGSQTQGVIREFLNDNGCDLTPEEVPHVKFELIVTEEDDLIAEISIARNFQNDVMTISIVGRRGQLDELEQSFQKKKPGSQLRKSETKLSEDYIHTERLLQIIAALVPKELWIKDGEFNKVYTYSMKAKCLKDFQDLHKRAHNGDQAAKELYQFYLDIAAEADDLYWKWKSHKGFQGTALRSIKRENGKILDVPDGIIFPILAALSVFSKKTPKGWSIEPPHQFSEEELIRSAKTVYQEIADSNPQTMGKKSACYSALYQITSLYKKLTK